MKTIKTSFNFCLLLICSILFITSCQTEVSPYTQRVDSTITPSAELLKYIDGRRGNDTFFISYQYDAQNKWKGNKVYGVQGGDTLRASILVVRDANGYVTRIVSIDSTDRSHIVTETQVISHNTAGRYTQSIWSTTEVGVNEDTTYFVYNTLGKIVKTLEKSYGYVDSIPYSYTGANLDTLGLYPVPAGYNSTILKYDNRTSPAKLGNEAFLLNFPLLYGTANVTMYTDYDGPTIENQALFSYTFNTNNNPVKAIMTVLPTNDLYTFYYHY